MSLIYLGWEFICVVCITLLCVQPIPILSAFFLCHPYIPLSNLKNFSFTCIIMCCSASCFTLKCILTVLHAYLHVHVCYYSKASQLRQGFCPLVFSLLIILLLICEYFHCPPRWKMFLVADFAGNFSGWLFFELLTL